MSVWGVVYVLHVKLCMMMVIINSIFISLFRVFLGKFLSHPV